MGLLGLALVPGQWLSRVLIGIAAIGIVMALSDLGVAGTSTLTLRRQTCPVWWHTLGPVRAAFLWGLDLGLGFTTIRVASLYWVVALVVFALASPILGAAILGGYGLALALNLALGVQFLALRNGVIGIRALRLFEPLKIGLAIILLAWSILLLFAMLKGI
ncbi:MAG TPA: hypothetical protein VJ761_21685 [Ktedonobacteraceae bacterium]|nr:hypothetical protein [Ktedonobacteraceae bacterium]